MPTTLITGANKSLGYQTAKRLIEEGHDVWIGARDPEKGAKAAAELNARFVQIDVTDDASVTQAAEHVAQHGGLDVLINNAGISGGFKAVEEITADDVRAVYETNVFGPVRVTNAFLPLLKDSAQPVIVNVSSGLGSFAVTSDPDRIEFTINAIPYTSSKSALNMVTSQYAKGLPGMRVNCVDPGYTATDFNAHSGHKTVEQGAEQIVQMALVQPDGPTGTYTDDQGVVPW